MAKRREVNRCDDCGLFTSWEHLRAWEEEDHPYISYTCVWCKDGKTIEKSLRLRREAKNAMRALPDTPGAGDDTLAALV